MAQPALRPPMWWEPGPADFILGRQPLLLGCTGRDEGETHLCLKAWTQPVGGLVRALELCRTQPQPVHWPPPSRAHLLTWGPVSRRSPGSCLLPHFPPDDDHSNHRLNCLTLGHSLTVGCLWAGPTCGANQWLSKTANGHSLTVGCLGEGPTMTLTNDQAGPLTVTPWQLATCGRGQIQHWPTGWARLLTVTPWQLATCGRGQIQHWPTAEQDY